MGKQPSGGVGEGGFTAARGVAWTVTTTRDDSNTRTCRRRGGVGEVV